MTLRISSAISAEHSSFYPRGVRSLPQGDFLFFSNQVFQDEAFKAACFKELTRHRVCLTNGYAIFQENDLETLQAAGCELFIYRWFQGFYKHELSGESNYMLQHPLMLQLFNHIHKQPGWILNPEEPMQGSGAVSPAFFFDYMNESFRSYFVDSIKRRLDDIGYDGVFFDYIGSWALPAELQALWDRKYPETSYDTAGIQFLSELRAAIGTKRIFGNQTYRLEDGYFQYIDYDLSESHATSFVWGKEAEIYLENEGPKKIVETFYRAWDDGPGHSGYRSIAATKMKRAEQFPHVPIFDLNYLQPWYVPTGDFVEVGERREPVYTKRIDRPAIFYGYALSKMHGGVSFASDWYAPGYGREDLYLLDLGEPLSDQPAETADAVVRYFANGFVVVTRSNRRIRFAPNEHMVPPQAAELWDVYEGTRVWNWPARREVEIFPAHYPATDSYYPSGRVFIYLTSP
jgi:hypothetical protein